MHDSAPADSPRLRLPRRNQIQAFCESLDQRIEPDHDVRVVWQFVQQLDLSPFHDRIKARPGRVGRDANDPAVLLALRLYAAIEGVGSARDSTDSAKFDAISPGFAEESPSTTTRSPTSAFNTNVCSTRSSHNPSPV